ncbi:hypothetical protein [Zavarzinia compransoris]|uniref:hypothetical protein n=1 Tax=Zavarzinia compransoris TaxID=1264899 RepID=UPI0010EA12A9|nr:hypothetical protein [Zavarzinia compransoris]TDP48251.1 hypothetical protein DES42_102554 [Zavarzinia compransoris]
MDGLAAFVWNLVPRADLAPDAYGLADDLLRQAQSTEGIIVIAAVVIGAWAVFRLFR